MRGTLKCQTTARENAFDGTFGRQEPKVQGFELPWNGPPPFKVYPVWECTWDLRRRRIMRIVRSKCNQGSLDGLTYTGGMRPIRVPPLSDSQRDELDALYRTTKDPRLRTRAQMVFLSAEQGRHAPEIAGIVRESEVTVQRWLKRYLAEGSEGLKDAPRPGRAATVTEAYRTELLAAVRRRPRSLDLPYSRWTLQRLIAASADCHRGQL